MDEERVASTADAEPMCIREHEQCRIVGAEADALKKFFGESLNLLRYAPTYKDDQRCLDASADVAELPDGTFKLRQE